MSRYDGLIIPRSYSDYINKTDAATLSQALQLPNVMDSTPTENSNRPVMSGGIYTALAGKQPTLEFDTIPTKGSNNPVSSGGLYTALGEMFIHNIPRLVPKDITAYITDGTFWKRLNGTNGYALFEDIYVGDYFEMSRAITCPNSNNGDTGTKWCTIADIDAFMNRGDLDISYHHAIIVPGKGNDVSEKQHFGRARMNLTNDTTGAYESSKMNTTTIGGVVSAGSTAADATINQQLYAEFGSHLKTTRELVSSTINATGYNRFGSATGCASDWEWISAQSILMSEIEVYGSTVWSSSGYDTGTACKPLALFQQCGVARNNRTAVYWLKDVASANQFCISYSDGGSGYDFASEGIAGTCVRPRFILAA